jgi:hypothetical protein
MRRTTGYGLLLALVVGLSGCGESSAPGNNPKPMPVNRFPNSKVLKEHLDKGKADAGTVRDRNP